MDSKDSPRGSPKEAKALGNPFFILVAGVYIYQTYHQNRQVGRLAMRATIWKVMRVLAIVGAMVSVGLLVMGIVLNNGAWSLPGAGGVVVFAILRYSVLGTREAKQETRD